MAGAGGAALAGLVAVAAGPASAQPLACGTTLTASVTLTANLDCSADTTTSALIIGAAGVTVNLGGHKIIGPGATAETIGIDDTAGYSDLTVEYGTLSDFYADVSAEGTETTSLTGLLVKKITTTTSVPGVDYTGVYGDYLDGAGIHSVTADDPYFGVDLDNSLDSTVSYSHAVNADYGFYDYSGTGNTWSHNTVVNAEYGIVDASASGTTIKANTVSGYYYGIFDNGPGSVISGNHLSNLYIAIYQEYATGGTVSRNSGTGNAWGIYAFEPSEETYTGNSFGSGQVGIETDYPQSETLTGNVTSHNSSTGVYIFSNGAATGYAATMNGNTGSYNRFGLYSQFLTSGTGNHATGNKVINCYNVTCAAAAGARSGSAGVTGPRHRVPRPPALPARPPHVR